MAKEHPIDVEVRKNRALEDNATSKAVRRTQRILLITAAILTLSLGIGIYLLPVESVSETENRTLATFPRFSVSSLLSGDFTSDVAAFYSDQFPLRDFFVSVKAFTESALLKQENNGVLIGKDGYLIDRIEYGNAEYESIDVNLRAAERFKSLASEQSIPLTLALAPRTVDVMTAAYPAFYTGDRAVSARHRIREAYETAIDLSIPLKSRADAGESVMFRTDHHWTALGAYYAYLALSEELGYEPLPLEAFTIDTVSESFYGTTYSKTGVSWSEPDAFTLYRGADDASYTVTVYDSGHTFTGFYDESFLEKKDKYSTFLGGNHGHVSVTKETDEERPVLLLVKDSFALSLVPFLARHYDLELIDLRYYAGSAAALLTEKSIDGVLILMGIDSLAEGTVLRRLLFGIS